MKSQSKPAAAEKKKPERIDTHPRIRDFLRGVVERRKEVTSVYITDDNDCGNASGFYVLLNDGQVFEVTVSEGPP